MKSNVITIVFNNAVRCSGMCGYCTVASQENYAQGFNHQSLDKAIESIKRINEQCNQLIKWDYDKLEETVINNPIFKNNSRISFSIWGADPLNSFDQYVEAHEYFKDLCKRHNKIFGGTHGSTNGMAFLVPEWVEWLKEHSKEIRFQISHDGLGQWIRTRELDPFDFPGTLELIDCGAITYISCVLNFWNPSPKKNIEYFENKLGNRLDKLGMRLYTVRSADYNITAKSNGYFNGVYYPQLDGIPIGDIDIHNDQELADKYNIFEMAHAADIYFDEIEDIYKNIDNPRYKPYRKVLIQRLVYNSKKYTQLNENNVPNYNRPSCAKFHMGKQDYSNCIDTTGKYTGCHLLDGDMKVSNPKLEKPDFCNQCKYKDRWECNICGVFKLNTKYCQWSYRFNQQMDRLKKSRWLQDYIKVFGKNWSDDPNVIHNKENNYYGNKSK